MFVYAPGYFGTKDITVTTQPKIRECPIPACTSCWRPSGQLCSFEISSRQMPTFLQGTSLQNPEASELPLLTR